MTPLQITSCDPEHPSDPVRRNTSLFATTCRGPDPVYGPEHPGGPVLGITGLCATSNVFVDLPAGWHVEFLETFANRFCCHHCNYLCITDREKRQAQWSPEKSFEGPDPACGPYV